MSLLFCIKTIQILTKQIVALYLSVKKNEIVIRDYPLKYFKNFKTFSTKRLFINLQAYFS